ALLEYFDHRDQRQDHHHRNGRADAHAPSLEDASGRQYRAAALRDRRAKAGTGDAHPRGQFLPMGVDAVLPARHRGSAKFEAGSRVGPDRCSIWIIAGCVARIMLRISWPRWRWGASCGFRWRAWWSP